ncbi:hypothetical protein SO802_000470 [Lithocarpus litseifolius]|uniref:Expansin-like EG45 domain-containing protein n=1 Tax=Lithocarpus litseifolius TaxID=425828 RepID=A0AAW2DXE8_9ROSI
MIAAASDAFWNGGATCGKYYTVRCTGDHTGVPHPCTGASVTVKIVDHCPGCSSQLDLSREAFAKIANPVAGIIDIEYNHVKLLISSLFAFLVAGFEFLQRLE